jgi:hypothetical protein
MTIAVGAHAFASNTFTTSTATAGVTTQATGSTFVICVQTNRAADPIHVSSIVDSYSNIYTLATSDNPGYGGDILLAAYVCVNGVGGAAHTATANYSEQATNNVWFVEITGADTTNPADGVAPTVGGGTTGTSMPGIAVTTTNANDLLLSFLATYGFDTGTVTISSDAGNGWAIIDSNLSGSVSRHGASSYVIESAIGTYNDTYTASTSDGFSILTLAFKAASSGGGAPASLAWQPAITQHPGRLPGRGGNRFYQSIMARASIAAVPTSTGTLSSTEATDTAAFTGTVDVTGALASTEAIDTASFTGAVVVTGSLAATEGTDTAALSGTVDVTGSLSIVESTDTAASVGAVLVSGALTAVDTSDASAITGGVGIGASLSAGESTDTAALAGGVAVSGALATTEGVDVALLIGADVVSGALSVSEATDAAAFSATWDVTGAWTSTENPDSAAWAGTVDATGGLAATEIPDVAALGATALISGSVAATENADTAAFTGTVLSGEVGTLVATDAPDQANMSGSVDVTGALAAIDAPDTALLAGTVDASGVLGATEVPDLAQFTSAAPAQPAGAGSGSGEWIIRRPKPQPLPEALPTIRAQMRATEAPDVCRIAATADWSGDDEEFMLMISEAA